MTTEYINGVKQKIKASFRVYDSYEHALADYTKLLTKNPRYAGVAHSRSPEQAAKALQAGDTQPILPMRKTDHHYSESKR